MSHPLPDMTPLRPPVEFIEEVCGIYFRSIVLEKGECVPQHSHDHDHATLCGSGKARLWVNGLWAQDIEAGHAVPILAAEHHIFQALEDGTRLVCVHDVVSAEAAKRRA
jgi:quercetin dioxygenase-like cupin family protein